MGFLKNGEFQCVNSVYQNFKVLNFLDDKHYHFRWVILNWEWWGDIWQTLETCLAVTQREKRYWPLVSKWRRQWQPTPVLLPGKSHGQRSLVGCSPWGHEESDTTERFHSYFSLSCTGEGNGNPLQCSCLENPRDSRAWWAAVCGVAQNRKWLKRLSSSSSSV